MDIYLPARLLRNGLPFETPKVKEWDGSTYFDLSPAGTRQFPSERSDKFIPVVGVGTYYPIAMNIDEVMYFYWRVKKMKMDISSSGVLSIDMNEEVPRRHTNDEGTYIIEKESFMCAQRDLGFTFTFSKSIGDPSANADISCIINMFGGGKITISEVYGVGLCEYHDVYFPHAVRFDGKFYPRLVITAGGQSTAGISSSDSEASTLRYYNESGSGSGPAPSNPASITFYDRTLTLFGFSSGGGSISGTIGKPATDGFYSFGGNVETTGGNHT